MKYFVILTMLCGTLSAQAESEYSEAVIETYVEKYKDIAVDEMIASGIPASIKLAQAILESNAGRSHLAIYGNNHFGIKCGGDWQGRTIMREDDDYKNGKLIKSCFRAFPSVRFSYKAHSEFLLDPRKAYRYGPLFELDPMDYKAWAKGLKKAGYATNPKYPDLLIKLIEKYHLNAYDQLTLVDANRPIIEADVIAYEEKVEQSSERTADPTQQEGQTALRKDAKSEGFFVGVAESYIEYQNNRVTYIKALAGDRLENIALETGIDVEMLMAYNDDGYGMDQELESGTYIYIERKKSKYKGSRKTYRASKGETIFDVAQKFGMRTDKLRKRNRWDDHYRLKAGDVVYLSGKRKK